MRKLLALVVIALAFAAPAAPAKDFLEGVEYETVRPQKVETRDKIEVREFFWYGCSHCYTFEPHLQKWLKRKPANAQLVRTPAVFNPQWAIHARAYYAFEALGITDKVHEPLFAALHVERRRLMDADSIAAFVAEKGGDKKAFLEAYNSFGVQASVNRAEQAGRAYAIEGVPVVFVDGRYMTNATLAGGYDRLTEVIDFLVRKAAAERGKF